MKDPKDNKTPDMLKSPTLTNAERQKAYRERRKKDKSQRLDVFLDEPIADMLAKLVAFGGANKSNQKTIVSDLIKKEYNRLIAVKNSKLKQFLEDEKKGTQENKAP